jgi:hypothetical protein
VLRWRLASFGLRFCFQRGEGQRYHLRCSLNHSLPHAGDGAAELEVARVLNLRAFALFRTREYSVAKLPDRSVIDKPVPGAR